MTETPRLPVAIDAMGGDEAPGVIVCGAITSMLTGQSLKEPPSSGWLRAAWSSIQSAVPALAELCGNALWSDNALAQKSMPNDT